MIMDTAKFVAPEAGKCVRTIGGHWAFAPAPLSREVDLNPLWQPLSRADAALGAIHGIGAGSQMPYMHILLASAIRREAVLSSRIEGTLTPLPDLLRAEIEDPEQQADDQDLREVRNYVRAIHLGVQRLREGRPISSRLVRELHAELMRGVRGQEKTPGEFRTRQNMIGRPGDTLETAIYLPPPVEHMHENLADWEQFVNSRDIMPDLIQCALMHERFEAIHPFYDGNGRVGRLLIPLFLMERDRLVEPLLYLSDFIEANRRDYYSLLQAVRTDGDRDRWIRFFLTGVAETSRKVVRQAAALTSLRRELRAKLRKKFRARSLLDELFSNPYINSARATDRLAVDRKTAQKSIDLLKDMGILKEITGKSWGRVWVARPILDIIENPPPMDEDETDSAP